MSRTRAALLMLLTSLGAPAAQAQFPSTGSTPAGTLDPFWNVSWTATALGGGGNSGGFHDAYVVNPVDGVWQPNSPFTRWISAWPGASAPNGVGDYVAPTNGNQRYTYTFRLDFNSLYAGSLFFSAGWDNIFQSVTLNGTSYSPSSLLVSSTDRGVSDHFGFCRNGDAIFDSGDFPNCTANFALNGIVAGNNWLEIVLRGDGTTDGLWLEGSLPNGPQDVTPEPATMTLLATGLAGMMGAQIKRRRDRKKS